MWIADKRVSLVRQSPAWGMMASWRLRASKPIVATSTPSSSTLPAVTSIRRNSASISEDLPLPVRPTTPQLVPPCKFRVVGVELNGLQLQAVLKWHYFMACVAHILATCASLWIQK